MEGQLAVPFHFASEFLVLVVAVGAAFDSLRSRRQGAGWWSLGQMLGFVALAAAQAIHGTLIAQADAAPVVVAIRAAGFGLLALTARPAEAVQPPHAGAAVLMPALFFAGPDVSLAAVPGAAALVTALRGARAHRADQDPATFAFTAAFVSFAAGEGALVLSPATGGTWLLISHALRGLAALFLARWLWSSIVRSVRMRFVAAFVVVLTIAVLVVSAALSLVIGSTLEDEELKRLADAGNARVVSIRNLSQTAIFNAEVIRRAEAVGQLLEGGRPGSLDAAARGSMEILPQEADFIVFVSDELRVLGSARRTGAGSAGIQRRLSDLPVSQEILVAGSRVVKEAIETERSNGSPTSLEVLSSTGVVTPEVVALGAAPVRTEDRRIVGAIAVGYRIDRVQLRQMRADTDAEVTVLVGGRTGATTFADPTEITAALSPLQDELRRAREDGTPLRRSLVVGSADYVTVVVPVRSEDGLTFGQIALSRRSTVLAAAQRDITTTVFLITLLAVVIAALLAWLSGGRVTRPIRSLTGAARELRAGNLQARAKVTASDEVGALGTAFNEMAEELQRKTSDLQTAAMDEAALRGRLEAIVQSMGDGLLAVDGAGVVVTANRAAEQVLGRKADRLTGRKVTEVLTGSTAGGRSLGAAALAGGSVEGEVARADGSHLPVALTSAPLVDATGEPSGRVILIRDVRREQEAERMKSQFLSNVSHELRTPITPIKGYAEIMRRKRFPQKKAEQFLEGIIEGSVRLERIVDLLVDFAALDAGRLKPRAEPVPVQGFLDPIVGRWRSRDGRHTFVRRVGSGLPPILGDARLLGRSMDELIDNAVKFSPEGGRIEIIAEPAPNGSGRRKPSSVRITVRDQGIGIEPERMPELFEEFRQLDGSETRSYGGLGLGLAYVRRIATAHGGTISVKSDPGRGSAFTLELPAATQAGRAAAAGAGIKGTRAKRPTLRAKVRRGARSAARPKVPARKGSRTSGRERRR